MKIKFNTVIIASIFLIACQTEGNVVEPDYLHKQFEKSSQNSAVSWWYLGDKGTHQYIAEKYPFKTKFYEVDKNQSPFNLNSQHLTYNRELWINIKSDNLNETSNNKNNKNNKL